MCFSVNNLRWKSSLTDDDRVLVSMEAQTASSAATQCQKRLPYDNSAVVDNENAPTNYLNRESISVQGSGGTITSVVKKQKANNKNKDKDDSSEVTENVRKMTLQLIAKTATLSRKKNEVQMYGNCFIVTLKKWVVHEKQWR